jgi:GntR family galactonate operon transcriptional repressor
MATDVGPAAAGEKEGRWPRRPKRMALAVTEDLVDRIVSGQFAVGSPLPNEAELCERYQASRTVIREAVQSAEAMRLVRAQQGLGTIVRPLDDWDLAHPDVLAATIQHDAQLAILEDLIDMRRALESQMAAHAAIRASEDDIRTISEAYEGTVAASNDPPAHLRADVAFHDAVMRASGNRLSRVANHKLLTEALGSVRYLGEATPKACRRANVGHKAILERIAAGDPDGAAQAMNDHIVSSWLRRRPSIPADPRLDAYRRRSA